MATLLQKIVERGHYKFVDSVDSWQEAVKLSTESMVKTGYVSEDYYQQIVDCITKYGPYVVYDHYVAMPHSQEGADGAKKTSVGFMRVKQDVDFGKDEDGEQKIARLFFTLAAVDPDEHLDNMQQRAPAGRAPGGPDAGGYSGGGGEIPPGGRNLISSKKREKRFDLWQFWTF